MKESQCQTMCCIWSRRPLFPLYERSVEYPSANAQVSSRWRPVADEAKYPGMCEETNPYGQVSAPHLLPPLP